MRAWAPVAVACLMLAGCANPGSHSSNDQTPGSSGAGGGLQPAGESTPTEAMMSQDLAKDLAYNHSLARFAVVADGDLNVSLDAQTDTPTIAFKDGCSAFGAYVVGAGDKVDNTTSLVLVAWTRNANVYAEATAAGTRAPILPNVFPENTPPSSGYTSLTGSLGVHLHAGERLVVEMGGDSSDGAAAPHFTANLSAAGPGHVEPLSSAPLSCGTGARAASGTGAGFATYITTAAVQEEIPFTSHDATTLIVLSQDFTGTNQARLKFLDQPASALPREAAMSSQLAGDSAILLDAWVDSAGELTWFFADTYWPVA